jgi:2-aminobenzoate-CoA ligase
MLRSGHIDQFSRRNLPKNDLQPDFVISKDTQYPARINAAASLIDGPIECGWGEHIALINDDASCTYAQLAAQANRIAHVLLQDMKLVPGNRVLLRGANTPMMAACWLGIVKAGMVAVATMPLLRAKELSPIINKAKVQAALCDYKLSEELLLAKRASPVLKKIAFFSAPNTMSWHEQSQLHSRPATRLAMMLH